jgi:Rrf2 family protein
LTTVDARVRYPSLEVGGSVVESMRLSTRVRYGARALVELAAVCPTRTVSVKEMAGNMRVSAKYLEQIMAALKTAGMVVSVSGPRGGYRLVRGPEAISLREVQVALEGVPVVVDWRDVWSELRDGILGVIDSFSIQELVERRQRKTEGLRKGGGERRRSADIVRE